jgi:hypothetical protein
MRRPRFSMLTAILSFLLLGVSSANAQMKPRAEVDFGVNGHALVPGAYTEVSLEKQIALLHALGLRTYRVNINPSHTNKFARLSRLLVLARRNDIRILPNVILPPQQYSDESSAYNAARQAMAAMARQFGSSFGVWEIGNEYDLYCVKTGTDGASPVDYNTKRYDIVRGLIEGMLAGLRDASPAARSIVETTQRTPTALDSGFLERLTSDGVAFDIVGYHYYTHDGRVPVESGGGDSLEVLHDEFLKPIWISEFDQAAQNRYTGPNADPAAQAAALRRAMREITAQAGKYEVISADIYELLDQPELLHEAGVNPSQAQMGIFDAHGGYTAAATAVGKFLRAHHGAWPPSQPGSP